MFFKWSYVYIFFCWNFLQTELKCTSILWRNLNSSCIHNFPHLFFFFFFNGLGGYSIICLLAHSPLFLTFFVASSGIPRTPVVKYFPFCYLFSSAHISHPETHKHTSFGVRSCSWDYFSCWLSGSLGL